jgi:hypothetical protein
MLPIMLIGIPVIIAGMLYLVSTRPDEFRVYREITIGASREKIASLIDDFHAWTTWSPWEKLDPNMKRTYDGPQKGVGAKYAWESAKAGAGRMEIKSVTPQKITLDLHFDKPMKADNVVDFLLNQDGPGTRVLWSMTGKNDYMGKLFGVFMDMDKMVGGDFEKGLAAMKAEAEK